MSKLDCLMIFMKKFVHFWHLKNYGLSDHPTIRRTDTPSYIDGWTHLKIAASFSENQCPASHNAPPAYMIRCPIAPMSHDHYAFSFPSAPKDPVTYGPHALRAHALYDPLYDPFRPAKTTSIGYPTSPARPWRNHHPNLSHFRNFVTSNYDPFVCQITIPRSLCLSAFIHPTYNLKQA